MSDEYGYLKRLKDSQEILEKLRIRRKEIKAQLGKELKDDDEKLWAEELAETSSAIVALDQKRRLFMREAVAAAGCPKPNGAGADTGAFVPAGETGTTGSTGSTGATGGGAGPTVSSGTGGSTGGAPA